MPRVWKITVGHTPNRKHWEYLKSSGEIATGYIYNRKLVNIIHIKDDADFENAIAKYDPYSQEQLRRFWRVEKDDLIVAKRRGSPVILGIGFAKSKLIIRDNKIPLGYQCAKLVDWIIRRPSFSQSSIIQRVIFFGLHLHDLTGFLTTHPSCSPVIMYT